MEIKEALEKHKSDCGRCSFKVCKMPDNATECLQETDIKAYEELLQYQEIGTVEQFREAMEKQKAKIPYTYGDGYADGYPVIDMYECPNCGETYEIECDRYDYCPKCGQRMDRSGLE